jgi:hypothetical protein
MIIVVAPGGYSLQNRHTHIHMQYFR